MSKAIKAWHFLADTGTLRDERPAPDDGVWLRHDGPVEMCSKGLHASRKVIDALQYAPGALVCRVECREVVDEQSDKLVCRERRILWRVDASRVLRSFARKCAMDVVHLWDAPEVVVRYLKTGVEEIRAAAWDAARAASRSSDGAAAKAADWAAAWAAARASDGAASRAAAWAVARAAAWDAAWAVDGDAPGVVALLLRAGAADWNAAWTRQERRLVSMLNAERRR